MPTVPRSFRVAQILLTLGVLEFFGPIVRDTSVTHLLNPAWVGHARLHLMWAMVFMGLSGLANLYLIWARRPRGVSNLWIAWLWQACNVFGFWGAALLATRYGGAVVDPEFHFTVMGLNENIFAFLVLTILLAGTGIYLKARVETA